ncbi:MAG: hypothetical protein WD513_05790, partial [Balneolaceae bacterium]
MLTRICTLFFLLILATTTFLSCSTESAEYYRNALPLTIENMMTLYNSGVKIAMGTDSGPPARF